MAGEKGKKTSALDKEEKNLTRKEDQLKKNLQEAEEKAEKKKIQKELEEIEKRLISIREAQMERGQLRNLTRFCAFILIGSVVAMIWFEFPQLWLARMILIGLAGLAGVGSFILSFAIEVVPTTHQGVERFIQKTLRMKKEGTRIVFPFFGDILPYFVGQVRLEIPQQNTMTASKIEVTPEIMVTWKIGNVLPAVREFGSVKLEKQINDLIRKPTQAKYRELVIKLSLDEAIEMADKDAFQGGIKEEVERVVGKWEIIIEDVFISDVEMPLEIKQQKEKAEEERLQREADLIKADKEAKVIVIKATADKEAEVLKGQGSAKRIDLIAKALKKNPDVLTLEKILSWDGVLPRFVGGGVVPFINADDIVKGGKN